MLVKNALSITSNFWSQLADTLLLFDSRRTLVHSVCFTGTYHEKPVCFCF